MKAIIQRVTSASVEIDNKLVSEIGLGLLCLIGIAKGDTQKDRSFLIKKILNLRIFADDHKAINKSVVDVGGEVLLVSQFTLYGDCSKGNRPSFINAMPPEPAREFYQSFFEEFTAAYSKTKDGVFGAHMQVTLVNDGPVTIILET